MSYGIHPFKYEVVCDVSPLDFCDFVLGQPYMWKLHFVYESRPRSVIITLGGQIYKIPEAISTIVPPKKCHKVISHIEKFILFTVYSKYAQKATATTAVAFYPTKEKKADCIRERRYCFFTYDGAYKIACQSHGLKVGGMDSTSLAIGLWHPSTD
jgi:hypothetical protein